jgi:prophage maintenance system killer protein
MMIFLGLNGKDLDATEAEMATVMTTLAAGSLPEATLVEWIRGHLVRLTLQAIGAALQVS